MSQWELQGNAQAVRLHAMGAGAAMVTVRDFGHNHQPQSTAAWQLTGTPKTVKNVV